VHGGVTPGNDPSQWDDLVEPYREVGVTWWVEDISPYAYGLDWAEPWTVEMVVRLRERIRQGPPKK